MTNPDSVPSRTAEEDITAQFTDPTGARARVRVGLNGYTLMTTREEMWREATIGASTDGAVQFRAFGSMSDGTVAAHVESRGRTQRVADLRIEPDGQWSSRIDDRTARGSQILTEARGLLRHPDLPVRLRRTRIAADGTLSWTADAEMRRNVTTDDGLHAMRTTSGTVHYSTGGTGTFTTTVLVATVDSIGTEGNAGAEWKPIQTDPGFRGFVHVVNHPNGSSDVTTEITEISTGTRSVTNIFDQDTPATPGHGQGHVHEVTETVFPGGGGSPSSTKTSETVNPDGSWEKTTTGVGGDTTVERGVEERGSEGTQSVTTSTVHGDGSVTLTTTTWGSDMRGTSHTTEVNPAGVVVKDEGAKTGTVDLANSTFRRPGDLAPIFTPDPPPPSGEGQPRQRRRPTTQRRRPTTQRRRPTTQRRRPTTQRRRPTTQRRRPTTKWRRRSRRRWGSARWQRRRDVRRRHRRWFRRRHIGPPGAGMGRRERWAARLAAQIRRLGCRWVRRSGSRSRQPRRWATHRRDTCQSLPRRSYPRGHRLRARAGSRHRGPRTRTVRSAAVAGRDLGGAA